MNTATKAKKSSPQDEVMEIITDKMQDKNLVPWSKKWIGSSKNIGSVFAIPMNFDTGKEYEGGNIFILLMQGYSSRYWLPWGGIKKLGGKVRKGEKGTKCLKWGIAWKDENGKPVSKGKENPAIHSKVFYVSKFVVWNAEQIEGIDFPDEAPAPELTETERKNQAIARAEQVWTNFENPPALEMKLKRDGQSPCYSPSRDLVEMPLMEQWKNSESFYKTLFHELVHSTGHEKRLARKEITDIKGFGTQSYSREELVAELGAAMLALITGCWGEDEQNNSAAYVKGWISKLKDDPKMLLIAGGKAQRACEHILGCPLQEWIPES
tara:strand:+ start:2895 stop:3863 length:969 start_codon:yes stop_codon:yes gene_type:complete